MTGARGTDLASPGQSVTYTRTITEADVAAFADVSGDHNPFHTDERFAATTRFGRRIVHGAMLIAYTSAAFTQYCREWLDGRTTQHAISYGYDRIRFVKPTFIGDTIATEYRIDSVDAAEGKAFATVTCTNQRGELVAACTHVLKFI